MAHDTFYPRVKAGYAVSERGWWAFSISLSLRVTWLVRFVIVDNFAFLRRAWQIEMIDGLMMKREGEKVPAVFLLVNLVGRSHSDAPHKLRTFINMSMCVHFYNLRSTDAHCRGFNV